jgi:uncharacterized protein (DUF608 family)
MKSSYVLFATCISMLLSFQPSRADALFNPTPAKIESPNDDADTVLKRLTINPDGTVPIVKKLDPAWIKALADRGEPMLYTKANSHNFDYIGMPVGGIGAGELYLSGDGKLWDWDIFGTRCNPGFPVEQGLAYRAPHKVGDLNDPSQTVLEQGFVIRTKQGDKVDTRTLDKDGFSDVTFSGQYPIGSVTYSDPGSPVSVHLEAFSPYIPSNLSDSSYPATILSYTVENTSHEAVDCTLGGWMENAGGIGIRNQTPIVLDNTAVKNPGYAALNFTMKEAPIDGAPPTMFDDFESGKYDHWKVEGDAFGDRPAKTAELQHASMVQGNQGKFYVDSFAKKSDQAMGKLTTEPFVINRSYITFLVGGGNDPQNECINLVIDGKVVKTATGQRDEVLRQAVWDVKDLAGKTATLEILDQSSGPWGHILVDNIAFADGPVALIPLKDQSDVGEMTLALLGTPADAVAKIAEGKSSDSSLDTAPADSAELKVFGKQDKLVGALRRTVTLAPGAKATFSFLVSWYFPNPMMLGLSTPTNRQYSTRFKSSQDVTDNLVANFDRLTAATRAWRDNWYDSTLPYYFLDRTFSNTSTLATSTSYFLSDGRFYGYEGRYSCPGTCTHVWAYQQAMGYLFPDLEKAIMEKAEFVDGIGMNPDGGVAMRGEFDKRPPVDGQAGIILRTYLAYKMSATDAFLKRNYASVKKATDYLITKYDPNHEGLLSGPQANTMDSAWFGKIAWLSLYYQSALRAMAEMADVSSDADYAKQLRDIADKGKIAIETQLFNGEFFIQEPDPAHPESPGTFAGCPIEQLMGQNWAYQVGMGDIIDRDKALTALNSMWKYNYTTDAGLYRESFKPGRWYADKDESGLIMCTFPHGGEDALSKGHPGFAAYDNECWTGSEWEATSLMMWDGLVDKALAETKSVQERYDGAKRNPFNELECGSHYSRAMASYGVFTAASGFEYNGPEGTMAFAPRVNTDNFKAAFTSAEGWGSFSQKYVGEGMDASLTLRYGTLQLKTLSLVLPAGSHAQAVKAQVDGKDQPVSLSRNGDRVSLNFASDLTLMTGQSLTITIRP